MTQRIPVEFGAVGVDALFMTGRGRSPALRTERCCYPALPHISAPVSKSGRRGGLCLRFASEQEGKKA